MKLFNTFLATTLLLSSLHAISYEALEEADIPKDSKSILDFKFDFDYSNLEGNSESFDKSELNIAANTEIYSEADIKKANPQDLYDFLGQNTSVRVLPSYGSKATQLLDLGGYGVANGYQNIVIKINGRRINNIDGVPQLLSSISVDNIKRIEILKGSGSVQHGDGATGGVINIILKKSSAFSFETFSGSFGTESYQATAGYNNDIFSVSSIADYYKTDGNRYLTATGTKKDEQKILNASLSISYSPIGDLELLVDYLTSNIQQFYAKPLSLEAYTADPSQAYTGASLTSFNEQNLTSEVLSAGFNLQLNKNLKLASNVAYEIKNSTYPTFKADYVYLPFDLRLKYASKKFELITGLDGFIGDRNTSTNITSKNNLGAFISYNFTYNKKHGYKLGYRSEKVSYIYNPNTGNTQSQENNLKAMELAYAYKLDTLSSIYITYNDAYLTPSLDASFDYPAPTYQPVFSDFINPQLSSTTTIGYKNIGKKQTYKASIFFVLLKDEIYYNSSTGKNTNLDKTQKYGINLYNKYQWSKSFASTFNYDYINASIIQDINSEFNNKILPGVSPHSISASIHLKLDEKAALNVSQNFKSESFSQGDFTNSALQKQEAYFSTNLAFSYTYTKQVKFFTKVQNLFDQANGIWTQDDTIYPVNFERNIQIGIEGSF
jgi:iron complex outermembrane recepter protein